jgi:hypothetical protein
VRRAVRIYAEYFSESSGKTLSNQLINVGLYVNTPPALVMQSIIAIPIFSLDMAMRSHKVTVTLLRHGIVDMNGIANAGLF